MMFGCVPFTLTQAGAVAMMKTPTDPKSFPYLLIAMAAASIWLGAPAHVLGQPVGCTLVADDRNPTEKILRCGDGLTIRNARKTRFQLTDQEGQQPPGGARLDSGALMIEFTPSDRQKNFQILTPHAIAAVRGTKWAVEVVSDRTSTLVLSGAVEVMRPRGKRGALLHAGEGADVSAGTGGITVKRWAKKRVDALLARFGQ
jgi:ferric-dicitrate binding protein FerR (iron transport regulator)